MSSNRVPINILDLVAVSEGMTAGEAIDASVRVARTAEETGYRRMWIAEHHNRASVASSATTLLMGRLLGEAFTLRIGSGGIMLPNHAPLKVAEEIGTLDAMHPGASTWGWAARRAPIRPPPQNCAAGPWPSRTSPPISRRCRATWARSGRRPASSRFPGRGRAPRCTCSAHRPAGRPWRRRSACRSSWPPTSPRSSCPRRWRCTGRTSPPTPRRRRWTSRG